MIEGFPPGEYPVAYFYIDARNCRGTRPGDQPEDLFHPIFRLGIQVKEGAKPVRLEAERLQLKALPEDGLKTATITEGTCVVGLPKGTIAHMVLNEMGWTNNEFYAAWKPELPEAPTTVTLSRKDLSEIDWSYQYREIIESELPIYSGFQVTDTPPNLVKAAA